MTLEKPLRREKRVKFWRREKNDIFGGALGRAAGTQPLFVSKRRFEPWFEGGLNQPPFGSKEKARNQPLLIYRE